MAKTLDRAAKIRELYLSLPDTEETPTWGSPHFRVAGKIFGGFGQENGVTSIGLKLEMEHADALVRSDPRFTRAAYVGHKGWVSIDVSNVDDWEEMRQLVLESYRLIAPKRTLAKLSGDRASVTRVASAPATAKRPAKASRRALDARASAGLEAKPAATRAAAKRPGEAAAAAKKKPRQTKAEATRRATKKQPVASRRPARPSRP